MTGGLFDSSILIDCLRGRPDAISFLAAHSACKETGLRLVSVLNIHFGPGNCRDGSLPRPTLRPEA